MFWLGSEYASVYGFEQQGFIQALTDLRLPEVKTQS